MSIPFASSRCLRIVLSTLTLGLGAGCGARILDPSTTPAATTPAVDRSAPVPEGRGRVILDVEEGPVRVRQVRMEATPVSDEGDAIQRWQFSESPADLCPQTPCAVDLPLGNVLLAFPMLGHEELEAKDLVHVSAEPTVYRRHLDVYTPGRAGMMGVGMSMLLVGLGSVIAGAVLLPRGLKDDDTGRTVAGAATLGGGALMFFFGQWLFKSGRPTIRPGSSLHYPL